MLIVLAGAASALIIVLLLAALAGRVREVYRRDAIWADLWARGPWTVRPVLTPAEAPSALRAFVKWFAPHTANAETVVEVRFTVSKDAEMYGLGPAGTYLAVVAFSSGVVLRWRASGLVPRAGFIRFSEDGWARREWVLGLLPLGWRTAGVDEAAARETSLLAIALSACWAPAALLENPNAVWHVSDGMVLSLDLPQLRGRPIITFRLTESGQPLEVMVAQRVAAEHQEMRVSMSDFANFDGYCLPRCLTCSNPHREGEVAVLRLKSHRSSGAWTDRTR